MGKLVSTDSEIFSRTRYHQYELTTGYDRVARELPLIPVFGSSDTQTPNSHKLPVGTLSAPAGAT